MAEVRPEEVSAILRKQLAGFENEVEAYETGTVLQVGDGVARVYGLTRALMSELVEFPHGVFGMVLNLEEDNVGCILFGESSEIKEGDTVYDASLTRQLERLRECFVRGASLPY